MTEKLKELARGKADWYRSNGQGCMSEMMVNEVKEQYIHMAQGGDGTINHMGNIREKYYTGKPNEFFQMVCDLMEWEWQQQVELPFV
jgi:hypothetical protein